MTTNLFVVSSKIHGIEKQKQSKAMLAALEIETYMNDDNGFGRTEKKGKASWLQPSVTSVAKFK